MKILSLQKAKNLLTIILLGLAMMAGPAGAHTNGFTYEAAVNNYFVDIGASKTELLANELILFEFNLYPNTDPNNLADFDSVYVTVGDETAVQLATFVHRPQDMLTVLSYSFPKAAKYEMSARFQKGTTKLAEVSFPVEVKGAAQRDAVSDVVKWIKLGLLAIIVVGTVTFGLLKLRWHIVEKRNI